MRDRGMVDMSFNCVLRSCLLSILSSMERGVPRAALGQLLVLPARAQPVLTEARELSKIIAKSIQTAGGFQRDK